MWRSTIHVARKSVLRRLGAKPEHPLFQNTSQVCFSVESPLSRSPHLLASTNRNLPNSFTFFSSTPNFDSEESVFPINDSTPGHWSASDFDNKNSPISWDPDKGSSSVFGEVDDGFADVNDFSVGIGFPNENSENADIPLNVGEDAEPEVSVEKEEKVDEGDLVEKLEKMLSLLQSSGVVDGSLESSLEEIGLNITADHVMKVLETEYVPGENLIEFFSWASRKAGVVVTAHMLESLTGVICSGERMRDAYALWGLLKDLEEKETGVLNPDVLNSLISFFARFGKGKAAYEVFNKFEDFCCEPNSDTYYFTIEALSRRKIYDWACSVCLKMLDAQKLPEPSKLGNIISFLSKGKKARDAHLVYTAAKENNISLPQTTIISLIKSLCEKDEDVQFAVEVVRDFSTKERKHALQSFSSVIKGLCRIKDVQEAKNLLQSMIKAGPPPGNGVFNTIITALSKQGINMEEAIEVLKMMEGRGLKPDVYTYTVIISGYVRMCEMEKAYKVLGEAKKKITKLSTATYHTLIRGFCKLEQFDKALGLFSEMKGDGVQPNHDEYNKLIQSLCLNSLDWEKAEELLDEMKANGLHLNAITKGLIRAVKEIEQEGVETMEITASA